MRQDGPYFPGNNGDTFGVIRSEQFVYQSFLCINGSPDWVYFMAAGEGSGSVDEHRYSAFFPPYTMGTIPAGGISLAWKRSSTPVFDILVTIPQNTQAERVVVTLFDTPQSSPIVGLPGTILQASIVSGDIVVDTIWWHDAAAGGKTGPDSGVKLLLTPNAPEETALRIVADAAQVFNLLEVLSSASAPLFVIGPNGLVTTFTGQRGTWGAFTTTSPIVTIDPDDNTSDMYGLLVRGGGAGGQLKIVLQRQDDAKELDYTWLNSNGSDGWYLRLVPSTNTLRLVDVNTGNIVFQADNDGPFAVPRGFRSASPVHTEAFGANQNINADGTTITLPATGASDCVQINPNAARVGLILTAGTLNGQEVTLINISAFTATFAARATSNVANGVGCVIAATKAMTFKWSIGQAAWFPTS